MELTPIQELIEKIKAIKPKDGNARLFKTGILAEAVELLPKEKQMFIDAYESGYSQFWQDKTGEDYFKYTFKQ